MASNRNKDPQNNFLDKLRSLLGFQERQKNTLPPKAHFSIWYFLIDIFLFTYLLQYFLSAKGETIPYSQLKSTLQQAAGNLPGKDSYLFDSLANPVASYGECARYCRFKQYITPQHD